MAASHPSEEHRPIKKPRLGPPDVYPQVPKQKEDELDQISVKHGFSNQSSFSDEYGSERNADISLDKSLPSVDQRSERFMYYVERRLMMKLVSRCNKINSLTPARFNPTNPTMLLHFGTHFSSIITKKNEINTLHTLQDSKKRQQPPMKDNFWPAARNKNAMETWFKDLAGNKPLAHLSKKVPTFNKKEETFITLCEYSVPMVRAAWYIKMTTAHSMASNETRNRKKLTPDLSLVWTQAVTRFKYEQLQKIQDAYSGGGAPQTSFLTATQTSSQVELEPALKHFHYTCRLAKHMFNEGLLDHQEFLNWLIELLDKVKQNDDTVLKLILSQIVQYLDDVTMSALLSRKLAYFCARKLAQLCNESGCTSPRTQSPMLTTNGNGTITTTSNNQYIASPVAAMYAEYSSCPQHRSLILNLSAFLQRITLKCPTGLVWNSLGEGKITSFLCGSPLDHVPCAPSSLPMLPGPNNQQIRAQIRASEHQIKLRGKASEVRWSSDKCQQSAKGFVISKVLHVLDTLDKHHFDKVDANNSFDHLYQKIYSINQTKDGNEPLLGDEPIIRLLVDWAVTTQRTGDHRAVVAAKLLERRQNELRTEKYGESDMMDDKDSMGSDAMIPPGLPAFQSLLMEFLDTQAPILDENATEENKQHFRNLIHLFSELIRHDVFSHDAYMCTLISRGDLLSSPAVIMLSADSVDVPSVKSQNESIKHDHQDDLKGDIDLSSLMESDFNSLFASVKDEQKSSPEPPASVKSVKSEKDQALPNISDTQQTTSQPKGPSRHMLFATHFPIPQDEYSSHECNQRLIVLYGVGKARDEARHVLKKISKEIVKLYSKRNCVDVSSGDLGKVKKKKEKEGEAAANASTTVVTHNYEGIFQKFQKLSYYDQHSVTEQCVAAVIEHINSYVLGNSSYLPLVDNISYLFDLMEYSLNINGLIEFICQMLKDLPEVEIMLKKSKSSLLGTFTSTLGLCIVSVLRKYHTYVLVSQDLTAQAFEYLYLLWKTTESSNMGECMSAKRCIISYLCDIYSTCAFLKSRFSEMFSSAYSTVKSTIHVSVTPSASNLRWDPAFMIELMSTDKCQPDPQVVKQLSENPPNRYSFVCNAILNICNSQVPEALNKISLLCAELTARCNSLSSEWLGVLKALCCSSMHSCGFIDILTQIDVGDMSIHDSLAVFTAILIARQCFSLQDLVVHVALPSLLAACPSAGGDQDAEPGARLTCHLLLRLFKTHDLVQPQPSYGSTYRTPPMIKASCDRHLLEASHDSITIGPVMAVLKGMLMLGDSCNDESKSKSSSNSSQKDKGDDIIQTLLRGLDDGMDMDMVLGAPKSTKSGMESAGLSEFSKHALKEMCDQTWVQEKFLKDPERLFDGDTLIDPMLTNKQAQQLLQMICYPKGVPNQVEDSETDNKHVILRILETLDQWSLRVSWLELQLMFKQATTQTETNNILDNIAKGTVDLFHQQTEYSRSFAGASSPQETNKQEADKDSVWLVAPLISKLPNTIQGRVLKLAGQVLESGNDFVTMKSKMDKEKNQKSKSLLGHQPFLSLVLTCLKGQDEQREGLLNSLHSQLEKFINNTRELLDKYPDETKIRQNIHESLQLRLSLVGGMFDTIQRNNTNTTDWALLLVQLISHDVVDIQTNSELFMTVIDMLSVLIHGTLLPDGPDKTEDNTKTYNTLTKKLRKEIADKHTDCTDSLRLLLPLCKKMYEVITCESHGTLVDSKGNKITGFDSIGKKQGLQVAQKVSISPWDVLEGHKNPAPISWSYFSAVKLERKPLKYEEQHRLLLYHTHSMKNPNSYYLEPPNLPPEDLEPPPEKIEEKLIDKTDNSQQEVRKKGQRRRRQPKPNTMQPPVRPYPYQEPIYGQPSGPHPSWLTPPQQQPNYGYSGQPMPGPEFPRHRFGTNSNSKVILGNILRQRSTLPHQSPYNMPQGPMNSMMMQKQQQNQFLRQQILQRHNQRNIYGPHMGSNTMQPMQGMPQNYQGGHYGGMQQQQQQGPSRMMEMGGNMMQQGYNPQGYQGAQPAGGGTGMMQATQQPGYMAQQPIQQMQPQYNQSQRMQPPMASGNMASMNSGMSNMAGYNQMGPAAPPQGQAYMQQQQQQQRYMRQQQMMQMQQQQQQQQQPQMPQSSVQTQQQQQTAQLVAQLQRQMSGGGMPGPQGQQYNQYQYQ